MGDLRCSLPRYFAILEGEQAAHYLNCKYIPVTYDSSTSTEKLWKVHDAAITTMDLSDELPSQSLLDLKIELAHRIFQNCHFCERRCAVDRRTAKGTCHVQQSLIASEFLHIGEERVLIPSDTIFFSGCTFQCVFCQNWKISQQICGKYTEPATLATMIDKRKHQGSLNVNWVGGDPTPNLVYILEALKHCTANLPQIWNSNMYCSQETMKLLNGIIDVYLTDFKYGNDECAQRLSKVNDYMSIVQRNHRTAYHTAEMIIRHLVMPNHITCCSKPILKWISKNVADAPVNIMAQYRPEYQAKDYKDIDRPVSLEEISAIKQYANTIEIHGL
ncbi:MAG: radical SAM protein [Candidatus Thermoplasmatota archaeon]|nr:radical SAM protein [Candidatus Thermoplasmatota archaeon]